MEKEKEGITSKRVEMEKVIKPGMKVRVEGKDYIIGPTSAEVLRLVWEARKKGVVLKISPTVHLWEEGKKGKEGELFDAYYILSMLGFSLGFEI